MKKKKPETEILVELFLYQGVIFTNFFTIHLNRKPWSKTAHDSIARYTFGKNKHVFGFVKKTFRQIRRFQTLSSNQKIYELC